MPHHPKCQAKGCRLKAMRGFTAGWFEFSHDSWCYIAIDLCKAHEARFRLNDPSLIVRDHSAVGTFQDKTPRTFQPSRYYDKNGRPISLEQWSKLLEDDDYKIVAKTMVGDAQVSTVWLGLDHGAPFLQRPVLFETMIFGGDHDEFQQRYHTLREALAGHHDLVYTLTNYSD